MFFIGDDDVRRSNNFAKNYIGFLSPIPEALAIVHIERHRKTLFASATHRFESDFRSRGAKRRRNSRNVKPRAAFERPVPVDITRLRACHGALFAIVDNPGWPLIRADFEIVDAETAPGANDARRIHSKSTKLGYGGIGNRIGPGQNSDVSRIHAERRQSDGNIRFGAAKSGDELWTLKKSIGTGRRQAQKRLTQCNNLLGHARVRRISSRNCFAASATLADLVRLFPTPTATHPARIHVATFSRLTPPVGMNDA